MMKRFLALLMIFGLLLSGCAAKQNDEAASGAQVTFYYTLSDLDTPTGEAVIQPELRDARVYTLEEMLALYFKGPASENLSSPFPSGTHVVRIDEENGETVLTMSGEYFTLSGVDLSLAACCLVSTVCDFAGLDSVTVVDEMERVRLALTADNFLLTNELKEESDTTYTLYFADPDKRYLLAEVRQVTLGENVSAESYLLRQLIDGPREDGRQGILPAGTRLLGVSTNNGVCTVNFSREFISGQNSDVYGAYMALMGVVDTLTSLEEVESVQFLIEGAVFDYFTVFPLDQPISRNLDAVGPVSTSSGEVDVSIYTINSESGEAFSVPIRVKQSISEPLAEAVVKMVLTYEPMRGFENPVPYGTELLSASVSGGVCYVDVSQEFIPADDSPVAQKNAVYAVVSALTNLSNVTSVVLTIEGDSDGLEYVDLSAPLSAENFLWD